MQKLKKKLSYATVQVDFRGALIWQRGDISKIFSKLGYLILLYLIAHYVLDIFQKTGNTGIRD
jgi:hypothetical protein